MKPQLGKVNHGDCIQGMAAMAPGVVDLAFADPPFNIGYEYDAYDDRQEHASYLDWSRRWIAEVYRVLKPDGTFWLAIGDEYAAELKLIAQNAYPGLTMGDAEPVVSKKTASSKKSNQRAGKTKLKPKPLPTGGFYCRSWVIWYYTFGVHCTKKFTRSHAHLFQFVKDPKNFTFNVEAVRVPSARQLVYADKRANPKGRMPDDTWIVPGRVASAVPADEVVASGAPVEDPPGRAGRRGRVSAKLNGATSFGGFVLRPQDLPKGFRPESDTWYFSRVAGTFKEREGWHGCQMPEQLLGRIIRASSNEGDVVLDPFAGSGTTLAVAKKLRRTPVGFELSKQYFNQATKRLKSATPGAPLDGVEDPLISAPPTDKNGRFPRVNNLEVGLFGKE